MVVQEPEDMPPSVSAVKLGVVYLGLVCGKHKYTLLDEKDIAFVRQFTLHARVVIDPDGTGAHVYATAKPLVDDGAPQSSSPELFHEALWKNHFGQIEPGCKVVHKNGITVDNRLTNLAIVPSDTPTDVSARLSDSLFFESQDSLTRSVELYSIALSRLPPFDGRPVPSNTDEGVNGEDEAQPDASSLFECQRPACCNIQALCDEHVACSGCDGAWYCSAECLRLDTTRHQGECQARRMDCLAEVVCSR
eukprot:m.15114 g.15114  ORF g.15114 m.15114 type:complete len:249 (-) comp4963_c0_seq1:207-953(-)